MVENSLFFVFDGMPEFSLAPIFVGGDAHGKFSQSVLNFRLCDFPRAHTCNSGEFVVSQKFLLWFVVRLRFATNRRTDNLSYLLRREAGVKGEFVGRSRNARFPSTRN